MDYKELDVKARQVAKDYRKLEQQLLGLVIQIDKSKIFYKLGFNSLFKYLTEALELSPAAASAFTNVARKSQEVPELREQVVAGKLSIYKAQRITSVLTPQNSKTWLALAETKTHRELEREVAMSSPHNAIREKSRYVSHFEKPIEKVIFKREIPRMELQLGISEKLMLKIRRAQDLVSQRKKKNLNLEHTLEEVISFYLDRRDPLKKAHRQQAKGKLQSVSLKHCRSTDNNHARAGLNINDGIGGRETLLAEPANRHEENGGFAERKRHRDNRKLDAATPRRSGSVDKNRAHADSEKSNLNERRESFLQESVDSRAGTRQVGSEGEGAGYSEDYGTTTINQWRSVDRNRARANLGKREAIPAKIRHQLQIRDKSQCGYVDVQGKRCSSKRYLEAHHLTPVSQGGGNTLGNLILLCSGHHKFFHNHQKNLWQRTSRIGR